MILDGPMCGFQSRKPIHKGVDTSVVLDNEIDADCKFCALALYRKDKMLQNEDAFPVSNEVNLEDIWNNLSSSEQDELLSRAKSIALDNNADKSEDEADDIVPGKPNNEWHIRDI